MSGKYSIKCSYINCRNVKEKKETEESVSFFKFPIKDSNRLKEWVKRSGNIKLDYNYPEELKNKKICEKHFSTSDFSCSAKQRKQLQKYALPVPYVGESHIENTDDEPSTSGVFKRHFSDLHESHIENTDEPATSGVCKIHFSDINDTSSIEWVATSMKTYKRKSPITPSSHVKLGTSPLTLSSPASSHSERVINMPSPNQTINSHKADILNKKLRAKTFRVNRRKNKSKLASLNILQNLLKHKSSAVRTLILMQIYHTPSSKWTKAEKQLALSLNYNSPSLYKFMRDKLHFTLPSNRTIKEWMKVGNIQSGINTSSD